MGWWLRVWRLLGFSRAEQEIDEELRFHVDMETEALVRTGLNRAEARRRALVAFGGEDRYRHLGCPVWVRPVEPPDGGRWVVR